MDDDAFLANVTEFLTENDEQLDLSSLPAIGDDVILDADTMVLLPSDVAQPDGRKGRREVRNAKAAERRRKYRVEVKAEKAALRREEDALSLQLKNMEADRANNRPYNAQSSMWRSVALRARWERVKAEEQYLQLNAAVTYRSRLVDEMKDLLRQLVTSPVGNLVLSVNDYDRRRDNLMLFQTIVSELDTLYGQVDQVFPHAEAKLSWPMELKLARKRSQGGEFLDSANATVIPFDFDDMCRALSILVLSGPDKCRYTEGIQEAENIYASQHTINFRLGLHTTRRINVYVATCDVFYVKARASSVLRVRRHAA
ncbi:hypothetical protein DVH05_010325 [Phytophthora capsici]|nr:hypothetical protein DVH05_010325 [Phytophthora capsici]